MPRSNKKKTFLKPLPKPSMTQSGRPPDTILFYSITKHHINKYHEISTEHPHHVPSGGRESCDAVCPSADLSPL